MRQTENWINGNPIAGEEELALYQLVRTIKCNVYYMDNIHVLEDVSRFESTTFLTQWLVSS